MSESPLDRLVAEMGAEVNIDLRALPAFRPLERYGRQINLEVEAVTAGESRHIWAEEGQPARVAIVWDKVRTGREKAIMRSALETNDIQIEDVAHIWAWPHVTETPPTLEQVASRKLRTLEALMVSGAKYVILMGAVVTRLWRPELGFRQVVDRMGIWSNRWLVWPMYNPIAVLIDPGLMSQWRHGMRQFAEVVNGDLGLEALEDFCVEDGCSRGVWVYDADGVGWCKEHQAKGFRARLNAGMKQEKKGNKAREEGML